MTPLLQHSKLEPVHTASDGRTLPSFAPRELDALYAAGRELYEREDFARAADVFRFLVLSDPLRASSWWALAACHQSLAQPGVACLLYGFGYRATGGREPVLGLLAAKAALLAGQPDRARSLLESLDARELEAGDATEHEALLEAAKENAS